MTDENFANQLLEDLELLLERLGLHFIVNQERTLASEGEPQLAKYSKTTWSQHEDFPFEAPSERASRWNIEDEVTRALEVTKGREAAARRPYRKDDVVITQPGPAERLATLIDLIEVATAGSVAMELALIDLLKDLTRSTAGHTSARGEEKGAWIATWQGRVIFDAPPEADLRNERRSTWTVTDSQPNAAVANASAVTDILDRLRAEIGVQRGAWLEPVDNDTRHDDPWNLNQDPR